MSMDESNSIDRDRELDQYAATLVQVGKSLGGTYVWGGRVVTADEALQSSELVGLLLKLGLFALNLRSMAASNSHDDRIPADIRVPAALTAIGFDYAITVAPRGEEGPSGAPILVDLLERSVVKIEERFGRIDLDGRVIERVASLARTQITVPATLPDGG